MAEYNFVAEEPVYYRSNWSAKEDPEEDQLRLQEESGEVWDAVEHERGYYWIESTGREDILAVPDFMTGEEAVMKLQNSDMTFEEFVEQDDTGAKIVEEIQEIYDLYF